MKEEMYESDLSLQCHSVYPLGIFMALMGTVINFCDSNEIRFLFII